MKKLAIITTHPIQYNAPWFRLLAERKNVELKVFYTWSQSESGSKFDPGFGKAIAWDIPLLEAYDFEFVENTSKSPGTREHHGIINPGLIERIRLFNPDALLLSGWNFKSHLQCLRHFHGKIPVLFRGDSTLLDESPGLQTMLRRIALRWVFRHIDKALYVGEANKKYFLAHGLKESELVFTPHAVDNARFAPGEMQQAAGNALRRQLGIPGRATVMLFAGKLEPKKAPLLLLETFLRGKKQDIQLVFVGNGILEEQLKEKAKHDERVHFMDFQNQGMMPAVYAMCDVFVLPSSGPGETWGLAVNEAMAAGKPVIVSSACGCSMDLVRDNENGWIFKAGDGAALEKILNLPALEPAALSMMGKKSQEIVQAYSFNHIVSAVENTVMNFKK